MADAAAIRCSGLRKCYGNLCAVDGLDLEVRVGECFGLLGPNGAGKTTTAEILEGLTEPTAGSVELFGQGWGTRSDRQVRERIGVALQETRLPEKLTVQETLVLFSSFYRSRRPVEDAIAALGLEEKRNEQTGKLSGGQRQRLALACALVGNPDMLFLDEPTTGLDPQARLRIWGVIEEFLHAGGTVFLTTHHMEEAERLCHRVGVIDHGRLIALGSPEELIDRLDAEQIVAMRLDRSIPHEGLALLKGVRQVEATGDTLRLAVRSLGHTLPGVLAEVAGQGAQVLTLETHRPTLEDVFVHLTGRGLRDA
jgi:ABC-2 type transport system ATP-binding protein